MIVLHSSTKKYLYKAGILTSLICALVLGGIQTASAETTPRKDIRQLATSTQRTILQQGKNTAKDIREGFKAGTTTKASTTKALRDNRASTTDALKANRASTTAALKANREAMIKEVKARQEALKKEIQAKKAEKKQKLNEKKKAVVSSALQNIFRKMNEKVVRLLNIDNRLNVRVNELRAKGRDVTTAASLLVTAKAALVKAQVDVEATKTLATEQAATSTSKEILKSLVGTAETSIKSATDAYKKVAEELRPYLEGSENASPNASTSVGTTSSTTVSATTSVSN